MKNAGTYSRPLGATARPPLSPTPPGLQPLVHMEQPVVSRNSGTPHQLSPVKPICTHPHMHTHTGTFVHGSQTPEIDICRDSLQNRGDHCTIQPAVSQELAFASIGTQAETTHMHDTVARVLSVFPFVFAYLVCREADVRKTWTSPKPLL